MKPILLPFFIPALTLVALAQNQPAPQPPVPVTQAWPAPAAQPVAAAEQRLYGPGSSTLIAPEAARSVVEKFRAAYGVANAPRIVVYVNRALVDASGLKLTGHTEKYSEKTTDSKPATAKTSGTNTYAVKDAAAPTLADQQTVRDIERLLGRAFRNGGAKLADQRIAGSMLTAQPGARLIGDQAGKEREALAQSADIAVEVLISSRNLPVMEVSGDTTVAVPDIQMTAIRLKDAAILGQASASDVLGQSAGRASKQFGVADITEATALALMEDMLMSANPAVTAAPVTPATPPTPATAVTPTK
ncbi:MAG: hypothetical protein H7343_04135 [Undibacterium sp.]|nr:hypothetical protein [Opitutaceae bacterium]